MTNFIIGTASFGNSYGVGNKGKTVSENHVQFIVDKANELGLKSFDTAPAYSPSESLLGKYLSKSSEVLISSKIGTLQTFSIENVINSVETSLALLKIKKLDCLYIHDPKVYSSPNLRIYKDALDELKSRDLISKVGISVYSIDEALRNLEMIPEIDVIQIPENLCDRRVMRSEFVNEMSQKDKEVILRSVYLQGLLLMEESQIPNNLSFARETVTIIAKVARDFGLTPAQLCLAYLDYLVNVSGVIVGISNVKQLADLASDYSELPNDWIELVPVLPESVTDPRLWK
jgi:aryl-alcohol dehydrogenase-like predicted oxidoreductase